jgi:hypothetical protein
MRATKKNVWRSPCVRRWASLGVATACALNLHLAQAIDVSPGAYIPAPAGKSIGMLYLGAGSADSYHPDKGAELDHDTRLKTQSALLRLFYMSDIGTTRVQYQVAIPYGSQDLKLNGRKIGDTTGYADPFVAVTAWPLNDPVNKEYLGFSGYLYLPLGKFDHSSSLNMGSNRYVIAFQGGYSKSWGAWRLDANADVSFYTDNDESGVRKQNLEQDPTFVLQPWLSYTFPSRLTTSVGITRTWGGDSELDGVNTYRATNSTRARLGLGYWVTPKAQVYAEMARDLEVDGGYAFDYTGFLRLTYVY